MSDLHAAVTAEVRAHEPGDVPPFGQIVARRNARARRRRALVVAAPVAVALLTGPAVVAAIGGDGEDDRLLAPGGSERVLPASFSARPVLDVAPAEQAVGAVSTPAGPEAAAFPAGFRCGDEPVADSPAAELVLCTGPAPGGTRELVRVGPALLTAAGISAAVAEPDPSGRWSVLLSFTPEGTQAWAELTGQAACSAPAEPGRRVALVVDGQVVSSPLVSREVACGVGIQGSGAQLALDNGGEQPARALADRLVAATGRPSG